MSLSKRSRLELAIALYLEHAATHDKKVRESLVWTVLFFGLSVWSALVLAGPDKIFWTITGLVLMVINAAIGIKDHNAGEMCKHKFRDQVIEIAYDEFDGPVSVDWSTGTYEPK